MEPISFMRLLVWQCEIQSKSIGFLLDGRLKEKWSYFRTFLVTFATQCCSITTLIFRFFNRVKPFTDLVKGVQGFSSSDQGRFSFGQVSFAVVTLLRDFYFNHGDLFFFDVGDRFFLAHLFRFDCHDLWKNVESYIAFALRKLFYCVVQSKWKNYQSFDSSYMRNSEGLSKYAPWRKIKQKQRPILHVVDCVLRACRKKHLLLYYHG